MESSEIRDALREADRAEAAPWVEFPPTPWWYVPAASLWAGSLVLALAFDNKALFFALIALELLFLAWYRRYRRLWPTGSAPQELRRPIVAMVVALAGSIGATLLVHALAGPWWAAATMTLTTAGILAWYERAYVAAARRTRERLA